MNSSLGETSSVAIQPLLVVDKEWLVNLQVRINELCILVSKYLNLEQISKLKDACYFAAKAHTGIYRKSGEPYIFHPLAVAFILANIRFDHETLIAALLHDVIEDTEYSKEHISILFGTEVAELVDGVSKLTQIQFNSKLEAQAENFRKMVLAMAKDLRVIMIKLADRLHNMRTLNAMRTESRQRIARETLEIYAPIAGRLGMHYIRRELEDLGFKYLYPLRFRILQNAVYKISNIRQDKISKIQSHIDNKLQEEGINSGAISHNKHLWEIYQSMRGKPSIPFIIQNYSRMHDKSRKQLRRNRSFKEVYDVYNLRIIVDRIDTCYRVLGVMHNLYKPIMGKFKDYIAIPKANGYQSLHTLLFGPDGMPIELQIRTEEMHLMAEIGVATHWQLSKEKQSCKHAQQRANEWLRKLLDMQCRVGNPVEFLESVKVDLFPDEVYVFTPSGEIIELPHGATAVDFAYAIHSDIGNTCIGVRIDRRLAALRTPLKNGQTVEIITNNTAHPNASWLTFVVTAKARASLRHYLNFHRKEATILGKKLLENTLGIDITTIPPERIKTLLKEFNLTSFDEILVDIGLGQKTTALIAKRLVGLINTDNKVYKSLIFIKGNIEKNILVSFGECCRPIPGDPIIGNLYTENNLRIHRDNCKSLLKDYRLIKVEWYSNTTVEFTVELKLNILDRRGTLAKIATVIAATDANIETVNTSERNGDITKVHLLINVRDRYHLSLVIRRLRLLPEMLKLSRNN